MHHTRLKRSTFRDRNGSRLTRMPVCLMALRAMRNLASGGERWWRTFALRYIWRRKEVR